MRAIQIGLAAMVAALLAVTGCDSGGNDGGDDSGGGGGAASLSGTSWRLTGWSANSLNPADFHITARFSDTEISGTSAVNSYGGTCSASGNGVFSAGALRSTMMAGPEPAMRAEHLYTGLLGQSRRYRVENGQLVLSDGNGNDLLIFRAGE